MEALQKQQRALESQLRSLRTEIDTLEQALQIERSGRDVKLEALRRKWRAASRQAAEEVYAGARDRVNRMGGVKAWRERERDKGKREDAWGWDAGGGAGDGNREDGRGSAEREGDGEGSDEDRGEEDRQHGNTEKDDDVSELPHSHPAQSLLLGWKTYIFSSRSRWT